MGTHYSVVKTLFSNPQWYAEKTVGTSKEAGEPKQDPTVKGLKRFLTATCCTTKDKTASTSQQRKQRANRNLAALVDSSSSEEEEIPPPKKKKKSKEKERKQVQTPPEPNRHLKRTNESIKNDFLVLHDD